MKGREAALLGKKLILAVVERSTGRYLGQMDVVALREDRPEAVVGYWIRASACRKGFATEALKRLCRFLFKEVGVQRVIAEVFPKNMPSRGVLKKVGMRKTGERRMVPDGVTGRPRQAEAYVIENSF